MRDARIPAIHLTRHAVVSNVDQNPAAFSPVAKQRGDISSVGAGVLGRRRRQAVTDYFEVALSGSGSGPRRARTRNLAPRCEPQEHPSSQQGLAWICSF